MLCTYPPSLKDEAAIRAIYRLKDRCYEHRDAVVLRPTDVKGFFVILPNGKRLDNARVWQSMDWRFAHQIHCQREERPVRIIVKGATARVELQTTDDYTLRTAKGVHRFIDHVHGWSDWRRTIDGWKQVSLRLDRAESRALAPAKG